jgi:DNA invertase Pin-like site-specific DNA recombinase
MSTFGSLSKGERNRIKIRVRAAMSTQAQMEGRYLGGRPPYGYLLIDTGPHPNPAKAADGKRLHILGIDEPAAGVVRRIFAEFLAGFGIYAIAEGLTAEGIPVPVRARPRPQPAPLRDRLEQVRNPRHFDQPALHRPPGLDTTAQRRGAAGRARRRPGAHDQDAVE